MHMKTVHENVRDKHCPYCDYTAAIAGRITNHIKNLHKGENKNYECPHCDYTAKNSTRLQCHLKSVHSKVEDDHKKLKEIQNKGLDDIWRRAKVTRKEYYEALRVTKKGKVIILKRNLEELWVNNYNPEWIRAWNGNMDVQICLDFFAIVTYITGLATW